MQRFISKENLLSKIKELSRSFEIIGPRELPNKGIFYQSLSNIEDLYLGDAFAIEPIKKFFLEPSTWILRHSHKDKTSVETIQQSVKNRIIIGVRPCEARGLELLDKVYDSDFKDEFYINNRKRSVIVGLACGKPDKSCFCVSMDGSPVESRGMDVLLIETENGFTVEMLTDKGKNLIDSIGEELESGSVDSEKQKRKDNVEKKINPPESLEKIFEDNYWDEVSRSCISCGICTYLCPTCHCFDLVDEQRKRLRCYDGCSFPDFTLQASGENPRRTKKERYRQRVFHKFDYFKRNFGENLCVGCGRCIRYCPVKIDIADIVDKAPVSEKK